MSLFLLNKLNLHIFIIVSTIDAAHRRRWTLIRKFGKIITLWRGVISMLTWRRLSWSLSLQLALISSVLFLILLLCLTVRLGIEFRVLKFILMLCNLLRWFARFLSTLLVVLVLLFVLFTTTWLIRLCSVSVWLGSLISRTNWLFSCYSCNLLHLLKVIDWNTSPSLCILLNVVFLLLLFVVTLLTLWLGVCLNNRELTVLPRNGLFLSFLSVPITSS